MSDTAVTATAWLQIKAERDPRTDRVISAKVVRITQARPQTTDSDVRMVRLRLSLPVSAFDPIGASVDIPEEAVEVPEIIGEVVTDD